MKCARLISGANKETASSHVPVFKPLAMEPTVKGRQVGWLILNTKGSAS